MMRRYSGPRHFTAGCTSPREPRTMKSSGLTTMPSPPREGRSSHQRTASLTASASSSGTTRYGVASSSWMQTTRRGTVAPYLGADLTDSTALVPRSVDVYGLTPGAGRLVASFWEWRWEGKGAEDIVAELRASR